ncbi:MAG: PAS domain S-box protein, partial [Deltaproteobacteria bacterium]|nr:PAS domain S-box protein [Deltaproteobacteria bacterium]
ENIIESSLDGIVVSDNQWFITKVNSSFLDLIGYKEEEVLGKMMHAFTPTEEGTYEFTDGESVKIDKRYFDESATVVSRFMKDGKVANWETYVVAKNGKVIPVAANIALLYKEGNRLGSVGIVRDISERRTAEREIRKEKDFLTNIIEKSIDGIAIVDEKGFVISVNTALATISRTSKERLIGKHISILNAEDENTRKHIRKKTEELFEKGYASFESKIKRGKDHYIDVECNISLVKDDKGNNIAGIAIMRDITGSKKFEEALLESEERYCGVVNNIAIGISLISPNMEILSLNNQMQQWFPEADATKKPVCYRTFNNPPRQGPCPYCPTIQTLRDGQIHESITDTPRGDKIIHYRVISSPLKDKEGRITSAIEMVDDITERMHAEEKILEYQNQLRSLASQLITSEERNRQEFATYLHDQVGQALCGLKIKLEMLQESQSLKESKELSSEMLASAARLIASTRSLTYELNPPILHELGLGAGLEWLAEQMHERDGIIVQFEDDGHPRSLEKEINILIFNAVRELLVNVKKHAGAHNVKVSIRSDEIGVGVCVEDNGMGFNLPTTGFPASKSNSFGLFSIKERLNYVGGHLDIKTAPGKGTRITLYIPHQHTESKSAENSL